MSNEAIKITVVMPALNEEDDLADAVADSLRGFDAFDLSGEVLVIDDGSTDRTSEIADALAAAEPRVRVIHHETPRGIGAAFWRGVDVARGELICMLPGDNENDATEIFRYADLLNHVDMVIPFVFNKESRSLFRNAVSFLYRFVINTTFLANFNYTNGTVLYRRELLRELDFRSTGFFFQTDILVRTVKRGYLFAEVPYRLKHLAGGESKAVTFPSLLNVAKGYLRLAQDTYQRNPSWRQGGEFAVRSATARRKPKTEVQPKAAVEELAPG